MRLKIIAVLVLVTVGLNGCKTTYYQEQNVPPVTPEELAQMRDSYRRTDLQARVGVVTDVLAESNLCTVREVPVKDFIVGDIISFVDSNGNVLAMGAVEAINPNSLTVRYENPDRHGRVPVVGDAAVRAIH